MKLPSVSTKPGALQAVMNLLVSLWSKFFSDRMDPVNVPSQLASVQAENGTTRYCESLRASFVYDSSLSGVTADGLTAVASVHGGVWVRQPASTRVWAEQADFYIDWDHGDDLNPGTVALPIMTLAEWARRVPEVRTDMTVHLVATPPAAQDPLPNNIKVASGASLNMVATPVLDIGHFGALDAWTAPDPLASAQPLGQVVDAAVNFTGLEGSLIHFVDQDAWCHIVRGAAGTADVTRPLTYSAGNVVTEATPVMGDDYHVYTLLPVAVRGADLLPSIATMNVEAAAGAVCFTNIEFVYAGAETSMAVTCNSLPLLIRCKLPNGTNFFGDAAFYNVFCTGQLDLHGAGGTIIRGLCGGAGDMNFWGEGQISTGGLAWVGAGTVVVKSGFINVGGPIAVEDATVDGVRVEAGGILHFGSADGSLSGLNNGGFGLRVLPAGKVTGLLTAGLTPLSIEGSDINHGLSVGDVATLLVDPITNAAVPVPQPCVQWVAQFYDLGAFAGVAFNSNNGAYVGP